MTLPAINFLWIGPRLSAMERLSLTSFVAHGHPVVLHAYDAIPNAPAGVTLSDASLVLPRDRIFQTSQKVGGGGYANFADLFRYTLLARHGGWWADCDVVCIRPFDLAQDNVVAATNEGPFGIVANNCVLKSIAGGDFIERCRQIAELRLSENAVFGAAGPSLVHELIGEMDCQEIRVKSEVFCPVNWNCCQYLVEAPRLLPTMTELKNRLRRPHLVPNITSQTRAIHLWSDMWKQHGWSKDGLFPRDSLYERLKRQHCID